MPIALRTTAIDGNGGVASTFIGFAKPAAVAPGDLLVVTIAIPGGTNTELTPPPGWQLVRRVDNFTQVGIAVYYRLAEEEPPQWVWSLSASGKATGGIRVYVGVDPLAPIDTEAGIANFSGASHPLPAIQTADPGAVLVASFAVASSGTYTAPTAYDKAFQSSPGGGSTTCFGCDRPQANPAQVASISATFSVNGTLSATHLLALRPASGRETLGEVRSTLVSHLPPGSTDLYDLDPATADGMFGYFDGIASALHQDGHQRLARLRLEIDPATAVLDLPDWERIFGLGESEAARYGAVPKRRAQVLAAWRHLRSSFSFDDVRAAVAPLVGYVNPAQLEVIEVSRSLLKAENSYPLANQVVPHGLSGQQTVLVLDDPVVSAAGVQITLNLDIADEAHLLYFTLSNPGATQSKIWGPNYLPAGAWNAPVRLYAPGFAGHPIHGNWVFTTVNNSIASPATITAVSGSETSNLFVEGCGRDALGADGLGAPIFQWAVLVDPNLAGIASPPDYAAAFAAIQRIRHAHTKGFLAFKSPLGDAFAVYDTQGFDAALFA